MRQIFAIDIRAATGISFEGNKYSVVTYSNYKVSIAAYVNSLWDTISNLALRGSYIIRPD